MEELILESHEQTTVNKSRPYTGYLGWIALVLLLPMIVVYSAALFTESILIPSGICHHFNGNGHGENVLCAIADFQYVFGLIVMMTGLLSIGALISIFFLFLDWLRIYSHNEQNPELRVEMSKAAVTAWMALVVFSSFLSKWALILISAYLFVCVICRCMRLQWVRCIYLRRWLLLVGFILLFHWPEIVRDLRYLSTEAPPLSHEDGQSMGSDGSEWQLPSDTPSSAGR